VTPGSAAAPASRHIGSTPRRAAGFGHHGGWYPRPMLYTILIILAIIALLMFIFGRSRVR
jgi:uncharacterized membrane protein